MLRQTKHDMAKYSKKIRNKRNFSFFVRLQIPVSKKRWLVFLAVVSNIFCLEITHVTNPTVGKR